jgi:3-oxoacyl-[acyl-carrier protein] reductase
MSVVSNRLLEKRVLITGAGRGIGQAMAVICSQHGAKVAICSRTESELQETASKLQSQVSMHVADVTNQHHVETLIKSIVQQWGGLDILINNAGRGQSSKGGFETLDSDELLQIMNLNVVAVHRVSKAALPHMEEGACIINVSSRAGKIGLPNMSFYVASKFALEGLTASMAQELKKKRIRVNSISPGMVSTQSFPKSVDQPGVRTPESVHDGLFVVVESSVTGHYLHVDELDACRARNLPDSLALKPIHEPTFGPASA